MTRSFLLAFVLALSVGLAACSKQPTLDASTPERLKASSDEIRKTLAGEQLAQYNRAVTLIVVSVLDPMQTIDLAAQGTMPSGATIFPKLKAAFDGLTAEDVIAKGTAAEKDVAIKLEQWRGRQRALEIRYQAYEDVAATLRKVEVTAANLRNLDAAIPGFGVNQVMIDLTVANNFGAALRQAKFAVSLMPPGINNPWVTQPFAKAFAAPIPAGGTGQLTVGPITVSIPEVYKGPVTLESQIVFERAEFEGQAPIALPSWSEFDLVELSKLEAAIAEVENVLQSAVAAAAAAPIASKEP